MRKVVFAILLLHSFLLGAKSAAHYLDDIVSALKDKDTIEAKRLLYEAHALYPTNTRIVAQLASLHYLLQEFPEALTAFENLITLNPDNNTLYNLAVTYCKVGRFGDAIKSLETILEKLPHEPAVLGSLLKLYARNKQWKKAEAIVKPSLWWFDENIYGKKILLDLDKEGNGFGDAFQFVRYGRYLAQAGASVIVKVPKPLVPLLSRCPYISSVITNDDPIPAYDKQFNICIVSLMCKSKNRITMNVPETTYLTANPDLIKEWKMHLSSNTNFKVGLCWESNFIKNTFTGLISPSPRAISIERLQPLAMPGISFYNLHRSTIENPPFPLIQYTHDFDESHGRFMDTAALIMNCDLIICVDTSIAHLAGALGKPTWLLLNCESDYRWFLDETTSYWYPSMRLFRQREINNWQPVVEELKKELEKLVVSFKNK